MRGCGNSWESSGPAEGEVESECELGRTAERGSLWIGREQIDGHTQVVEKRKVLLRVYRWCQVTVGKKGFSVPETTEVQENH